MARRVGGLPGGEALAGDADKLRQYTADEEIATSAVPLAAAPAAGAADTAAAGQTPPAPPDHNINEMVDRLAERLKKSGSDVNGWLQLVRSYRVLGQNDKMQSALADARKALANDAEKLAQFNAGTGSPFNNSSSRSSPASAVSSSASSDSEIRAASASHRTSGRGVAARFRSALSR